MIAELGHFALILALCLALCQSLLPLSVGRGGRSRWFDLAVPAARAQLLMLLLAFACLAYSFVTHDFSVRYVAQHSNTALPLGYRLAAIWGAHEGSLLLWVLLLSAWTVALTRFSRQLPSDLVTRTVGVMGLLSAGFLLFILFTSNPFIRQFPVPVEGGDLNPLLQDPGLALHPPILYMGYVGLAVAFSVAVAALLQGRLEADWARWLRPWTVLAWLFLTLGIALGSWWAYYELGWGGWWFWDPVENASLMPWLVATALVHSLAVTEKRGAFQSWTLLLAILGFSLSLLGTFLVRSGVLNSVHAFASDPSRGVFILLFLVVVVGGSLGLYARRAPAMNHRIEFSLVSRESALLLNNLLLLVAAATILLGTLYPLALEALGLGKISVGPPYFNTVFVPLALLVLLLMPLGMVLRWKQDDVQRLKPRWMEMLLVGLLSILIMSVTLDSLYIKGVLGLWLAGWVGWSSLRVATGRHEGSLWQWRTWRVIGPSGYGMTLAHFGVAIMVVGVTITSLYSEEQDIYLEPGGSYELAGYRFELDTLRTLDGPNYQSQQATVHVRKGEQLIAKLTPEKRTYAAQQNPMTEAAIDAGLIRDLFVALGEPRGQHNGWTIRLYYKPFVRWIWLGALIMALGGLLAILDRRYRRIRLTQREQIVSQEVSAGEVTG